MSGPVVEPLLHRKSILFVSWNFPPRRGGIEEMVRQLFTHLSEKGPVRMLTGWTQDPKEDPPGVSRSPLRGLFGFLLWLGWRLPLELARGHDVVLSSGALVGSVVEPLARVFRRPRAVIVYGTDITYPSRLYQAWLRLVLPSVPRVLAISRATTDELVQRGFARPARIELLPPGIAPAMIKEPISPDLSKPEVPLLLFVGRLIERKGLVPFLKLCLPRILERRPVELWVIGADPSESLAHRSGELERIRQAIAEAGVEDRVRLLGAVPDSVLRAAYRCARILILPAISIPGDVEGFGIVFLEAALFCVPSVSTKLGGIPDAVSDGESGLLVGPGDWQAFAEAVLALTEDEELCRDLGRRARRRALEFDWHIISNRCRRVLEELSQ